MLDLALHSRTRFDFSSDSKCGVWTRRDVYRVKQLHRARLILIVVGPLNSPNDLDDHSYLARLLSVF
jgi:hypothetical protein